MGRKSFIYGRDSRGRRTLTVERIHGGDPGDKTIGLVFSSEGGVRFAISMIVAAFVGRPLDITVWRKPRPDGKHNVTVTSA